MEEDEVTPMIVPERGRPLPFADPPRPVQATKLSEKYRVPIKHPGGVMRLPKGPRAAEKEHKERLSLEEEVNEVMLVSSCLGVVTVPEHTVGIVERLNQFHRILGNGVHMIIPGIERVTHAFSTAVLQSSMDVENVFTRDNVRIKVQGFIFFQIIDPKMAAYKVKGVRTATKRCASDAIHKEFCTLDSHSLFGDLRGLLNRILADADRATRVWGVQVFRVAIEVLLPDELVSQNTKIACELQKQRMCDLPSTDGSAYDPAYERPQYLNGNNRSQRSGIESMQFPPGLDSPVEPEGMSRAEIPHPSIDSPFPQVPLIREGRRSLSEELVDRPEVAEQIAKIADVLQRPGASEAARVYIATKYIDVLAFGMKSANTRITINLTGPGQMLDEALGVQPARQSSVTRQRSITMSDTGAMAESSADNIQPPPVTPAEGRPSTAAPESVSAASPMMARTTDEWVRMEQEVFSGKSKPLHRKSRQEPESHSRRRDVGDRGERRKPDPIPKRFDGVHVEAQLPLRRGVARDNRAPKDATSRPGYHGTNSVGVGEIQWPLPEDFERGDKLLQELFPRLDAPGDDGGGIGEAQLPLRRDVPRERSLLQELSARLDDRDDDDEQSLLHRGVPDNDKLSQKLRRRLKSHEDDGTFEKSSVSEFPPFRFPAGSASHTPSKPVPGHMPPEQNLAVIVPERMRPGPSSNPPGLGSEELSPPQSPDRDAVQSRVRRPRSGSRRGSPLHTPLKKLLDLSRGSSPRTSSARRASHNSTEEIQEMPMAPPVTPPISSTRARPPGRASLRFTSRRSRMARSQPINDEPDDNGSSWRPNRGRGGRGRGRGRDELNVTDYADDQYSVSDDNPRSI